MGATQTKSYTRKRNSYSVDNLQYSMDSKIKPINLQQINQKKSLNKSLTTQQLQLKQTTSIIQRYKQQKQSNSKNLLSQNKDKRLKLLNQQNDQLRAKLIQISQELGQKLKKKKPTQALKQKTKKDSKISTALQKQLQNGYKQIDMYKRRIQKIKIDPNTNPQAGIARLQGIQNGIKNIDIQIKILQDKIDGIKNINKGQQAAIQKNYGQQQSDESYKKQIEIQKINLRQIKKREKGRQQKTKRQQIYLYQLQKMISQMNGDYYPDLQKLKKEKETFQKQKQKQGNSRALIEGQSIQLPSKQDFKQLQKQSIYLKLKHQDYKRKLNNIMKEKSLIKNTKQQLSKMIKAKQTLIEGLRQKRDVLYKVIKDYEQSQKQRIQQLSQFSSQSEHQQEHLDQVYDAFNINHLKQDIPKKQSQRQSSLRISQTKSQVKKWQKKITRILTKGDSKNNQKEFDDSYLFKKNPQADILMVGMNIWLNKQKKIIAIQGVYLYNNQVKQGQKTSKNQDQYIIRYQLSQGDYIKSIVALFGVEGFLQYLMINSKKKKLKKYGRQPSGGQRLACGLSQNERPMILSGATALDGQAWRINKLSVQVCLF